MMPKYDVIVIGAGPGGYEAAVRSAQLGLKTACIDKRAEPGGTCLNVGCIPSKALLYSTELYSNLKHHGLELGIIAANLSIDFPQMMKRKKKVVQGLVEGATGVFKQHKIDFIVGEAHFVDSHTLEVNNQKIEANNFIIATGSEPIGLQDLPFDEKQILSSTGALSLTRIPKRMVVVGGGSIGVELASVYQRLGSDITIVEMLDHICPAMDRRASQTLLQILKRQGIKFFLSSRVVTAVVQPDEVILTIDHADKLQNLSTEAVLVSIGRRPYCTGLNLEKLGIKLSPKKFVEVDGAFRTSHPHIYAIGDVIEGVMLAHRATAEGHAVAELIARQKTAPIDYMIIPNVIYTFPEVAAVGMTEEEAITEGFKIVVGSSSFKGNSRARCMDETDGFVKIIGEAGTGRLLGMHIVGPAASEMIQVGMVAMDKGATVHEIALEPTAHPTLSEAIKEAAKDLKR